MRSGEEGKCHRSNTHLDDEDKEGDVHDDSTMKLMASATIGRQLHNN